MMAKMRYLFVVNVLVLKIMVGAAETPDGQAQWAHKDAAATSAGTTMTDGRNVISPRMDFEEWTPLGRGDPLKNDPTFDYLPPVLDRVHYWKPPPPPAATNRAHYYSSASTATPTTPPSQTIHGGGYNRRFFLTDFSKREPVVATYAAIKRPPSSNSLLQPHHYHHHHPQQQQQQQIQHHLQTLQAAPAAGYHYSMHPAAAVPRTPLPMLTPPPYQQWSSTASDVQRQSASDVPGNAVAESKQPPPTMVRAPTRPVSPSSNHLVIVKALLDDEVDRTTVTTTSAAVWMTTTTPPPPPPVTMSPTSPPVTMSPTSPPATSMTAAARTTPPPPVVASDPLFEHYRQSPVTGRPMYLIIQGHSKVKTYGSASKMDDLNAAPVVQDHNHIGNQPLDEPSRRKRDHYRGGRR